MIVCQKWLLLVQDIRCVNQIEDVCRDVEKTINQTIQNTLNQLEKDCDHIGALVDEAVDKDNKARSVYKAKCACQD